MKIAPKRRRKRVKFAPSKIAELRREAKLTQAQLAARLGWHVMRLSRIELGRTRALADDITALSAALGVTSDRLLGEAA